MTAIVGVVLVAIWWFALFSPQSHQLAAQHRARAAAEEQASTLDGQARELNALVHQIPGDRVKLAQYSAAIPVAPDLSAALRDIQQAASSSGASMSSLTPASQTTGSSTDTSRSAGGVSTIGVTIAATGSYNALMAFMSSLAQMPRTLVVTSLNLSGSGSSLSAQISSNIFYTK